MKVRCECGKEYDVPNQMVGKSVRCSKCSRSFTVPVPSEPPQAATVQMTQAVAPPRTVEQARPQTLLPASSVSTQWITAPVASSDPKTRAEREQQIVAQYVQYKPKPGEPLRGAELRKAKAIQLRKQNQLIAFKFLGLGVGALFTAIGGYFALESLDPYKELGGDSVPRRPPKVHWLMSLLYLLGGKWAAAIGFGLIALALIVVSILYFTGVLGARD
jgi:hypothetical protein